MPDDLLDMPLIEDIVAGARATIVHSEFARQAVLRHVPRATVVRVPMGIPLPALVDRDQARDALNLPREAFVIASITHVNPYKRLPVVLRALRRAVRHIPDAILVVAGSVAPRIDLASEVAFLRLQRHVMLRGYVDDTEARLIARAADVCVNLRYPSAGETSASLLRMMGAARPVIVTDDATSGEYSRDAVLPVAVDRFEEEILAELLVDLHDDTEVRELRGRAAREYVEREHTMQVAVEGYRRAIKQAYDVELPAAAEQPVVEQPPTLPPPRPAARTDRRHFSEIVDAVSALGIASHDPTLRTLATAMLDLNLGDSNGERREAVDMDDASPISEELLSILACPICKTPVRLEGAELVCDSCGRHYKIEDGIPIMLVEDDE
jgi:uncharacterized protein YbaR (Trm112 family)